MVGAPHRVGRYELHTLLGRGGSGEVWAATLHGPRGFLREVAVKRLHQTGVEPDALAREARVGARLAHPNLVATHDLLREEDGWLVVMERVHGPSVADLRTGGPLPPWAVVEIGLQTCAALGVIHDADLVHRDIKPANLLLDRSGLVKVADLGLAELVGTPVTSAGTPGYAPLEQLEGAPEPRSDLFALGATLVRLATGVRALGRGHRALAAARDVERSIARHGVLEAVDEAVPGLGAVVADLLRTDPGARPGSAAAVAERLGPIARAVGRRSLATLLGDVPDAFIGRDAEVDALVRRLRDGPGLVTLLGPGGVGKTRLALETARRAQQAGMRVRFCDLSGATTVDGVVHVVGRCLGIQLSADDPVAQLGTALARPGGLIVLDNLEQVVAPAAEVVARWLSAAPELRILGTSRTPLRIRGERLQGVEPLELDAAVRLFVERAPRPPPADETAAVERLVEALDRLPLAIELAAARTRVFDVDTLLAHLDQRFRLLASGDRSLPPRHRSLRASLEASWALLDPAEQQALAQLSVFAGPFTLEAAEAVVALDEDGPWLVDVLDALVAHSLLTVRERRFGLLVSVRAFADEQLAPLLRTEAVRRHVRYFGQRAERLAPRVHVRMGRAELRALGRDLPDFVQAALRGPDIDEVACAVWCGVAVGELVQVFGPLRLGEQVVDRLLETVSAEDDVVAQLRIRRASLHLRRGEHDALERVCRETLARFDEPSVRLRAANQLSVALRGQGRMDEAVALLGDCLGEVPAGSRGAGLVHALLARCRVETASFDAGREHFEQVEAIAEAVGDRVLRCRAVYGLATVAFYQTDWERALEHADRYSELLEEAAALAMTHRGLALHAYASVGSGDLAMGERGMRRVVGRLEEVGLEMDAHHARANLSRTVARRGRLEEAVALSAESRAFFEAHEVRSYIPWIRMVHAENLLDLDRVDEAASLLEGIPKACLELGHRREATLALYLLAEVERRRGQLEAALDLARRARDTAPTAELGALARGLITRTLCALGRSGEAQAVWRLDREPRPEPLYEVERLAIDACLLDALGEAAAAEERRATGRRMLVRLGVGPRSKLWSGIGVPEGYGATEEES